MTTTTSATKRKFTRSNSAENILALKKRSSEEVPIVDRNNVLYRSKLLSLPDADLKRLKSCVDKELKTRDRFIVICGGDMHNTNRYRFCIAVGVKGSIEKEHDKVVDFLEDTFFFENPSLECYDDCYVYHEFYKSDVMKEITAARMSSVCEVQCLKWDDLVPLSAMKKRLKEKGKDPTWSGLNGCPTYNDVLEIIFSGE